MAVLWLAGAGCLGGSGSEHGSVSANLAMTKAKHSEERHWIELVYRAEGGDGILESDRFALVFPNLGVRKLRSFFFPEGKTAIQIGGEGVSEVSVKNARSSFLSRYENGTNTIVFCGREVRLADQGQLILTTDAQWNARAGVPRVRVESND